MAQLLTFRNLLFGLLQIVHLQNSTDMWVQTSLWGSDESLGLRPVNLLPSQETHVKSIGQ